MEEFVNETLDEVYEYRGVKVEIWNDDYGQCKFIKFVDPTFGTESISLGTYNFNYKEDIEYIIDEKLDNICRFESFPGSQLKWFFNGWNNRDIELLYRTRVIKVFLVADESKINLADLKEQAEEILTKYVGQIK